MIDNFYAKRLTAEMYKEQLSAQPDEFKEKNIQKRAKALARNKR